jgi:protein TonB
MERENGIQGKVFIEFIVRPDGSVTDVKVLRGVAGGPGLDKEAMRVIKSSPKWKPGKQNGKEVSVYYRVPVSCSLR